MNKCRTYCFFRPPADICSEFEVEKTELPASVEYFPVLKECCFLLIVISGDCIITTENEEPILCSQGHVYFASAGIKYDVKTNGGVVFYKANVNMCNV